jgi:hypothetical protein
LPEEIQQRALLLAARLDLGLDVTEQPFPDPRWFGRFGVGFSQLMTNTNGRIGAARPGRSVGIAAIGVGALYSQSSHTASKC